VCGQKWLSLFGVFHETILATNLFQNIKNANRFLPIENKWSRFDFNTYFDSGICCDITFEFISEATKGSASYLNVNVRIDHFVPVGI
jgi:hypothetical protein